jgi:hypothetical protein
MCFCCCCARLLQEKVFFLPAQVLFRQTEPQEGQEQTHLTCPPPHYQGLFIMEQQGQAAFDDAAAGMVQSKHAPCSYCLLA